MANGQPLFRTEALKWRQEAWIGDTLEIEPVSGKIAAWCTMALVLGVIIYVIFGSYTRRVHATGQLMPPGGLVVITADQAGVVTTAHIKEGMSVHAGQALYTVDVESWSSAGPTGKQALLHLLNERDFLTARRKLLLTDAPIELASFKQALVTLQKQREMLGTQIQRDNTSLPLIEHAMQEMRTAIGMHLVSEGQFQSQLFSYVQFMNTHSQTLRSMVETGGQINDLQYKIDRHPYKVQEDVTDIDVRLADLNRQITQARGQAETLIVAPVAGVIDGIRTYVGQRVSVGQPMATLLPDNATLQAELYVDSHAIGFLRPGQRVLLKFAPFPYQKFGLYKGTVTEVTRAPMPDQAGSVAPQGKGAAAQHPPQDVYRVRVLPDQDFVRAYGKKERLQPGMAVEADIATDRRKLYQWLFDPIISMADDVISLSGKRH
ncbi:HlyD family efflux transporter periplasmic adaptor subunit [Oecophyllibacter saccharovorans]|uniref:HlyD family efflux transporter periplasmic adaptor subunit n=1 Tax=Oecophyllibacter saccharovorans TaxID=2558360 RepID=A0A506UR43_9PROT|nr:HlyD family efflux transporter periplasmic adaptor subunit [Oecophyllibacter saccharovorans]TPW35818.1 HlyD family efflux transporter periplasmic adaptor subunit [Oecophyllibacter saccharovorans]